MVRINNIDRGEGRIWIGIYPNSESFLDQEKVIIAYADIQQSGVVEARIPNLPFGDYALALFQDINRNDLLDQNWLGIPIEPYAFSRPWRHRFRLPQFQEVKFSHQMSNQTLQVGLQEW